MVSSSRTSIQAQSYPTLATSNRDSPAPATSPPGSECGTALAHQSRPTPSSPSPGSPLFPVPPHNSASCNRSVSFFLTPLDGAHQTYPEVRICLRADSGQSLLTATCSCSYMKSADLPCPHLTHVGLQYTDYLRAPSVHPFLSTVHTTSCPRQSYSLVLGVRPDDVAEKSYSHKVLHYGKAERVFISAFVDIFLQVTPMSQISPPVFILDQCEGYVRPTT